MQQIVAQTYCRSYGDIGTEYSGKSIQTSDGGFLITGNSNSWSGDFFDFYIVKTDSAANQIWSTVVYTEMEDIAKAAVELNDGSFLIAGSAYTEVGGYDVALVQLNAAGELITSRFIGDETNNIGNQLIKTIDGGYVVVGYTDTVGAALITYQPMILKLNAALEVEWSRRFTFCGTCSGEAMDVVQLQDGNLIVTGYLHTGFPVTTGDMFVAKFTSTGTLSWFNKSGKNDKFESGNSIVAVNSDKFIIAGSSFEDNYDIYLSEIDGDGNTIWQKIINSGTSEMAAQIIQTHDNQYAIAGTRDTGEDDYYLLKLDTAKQIVFSAFAGGDEIEAASGLLETKSNNFLLTGHGIPIGEFYDEIYVLQFDETGYNCSKTDSGGTVEIYDGAYTIGGFAMPITFAVDSGAEWFSGSGFTTICADTATEDTSTISLDEVKSLANCRLYPNPAASFVEINNVPSGLFTTTIKVLNSSGQLVYETVIPKGQTSCSIDVSGMSDGLYLVNISNGDNYKVFQLVVTHN
ncbi:MAG: T9SS type A sorting domain-containing protein [Chitinophagales bacterium]|nr:T9SS type A sorting domain-containing protein [Chitinophagales bacterium]